MTPFESSVNSDGTQTPFDPVRPCSVFESSVNSDGTQTIPPPSSLNRRLRAV